MNALVSGKYYRVRPAFEDDFTRYSTSNYRMVDLIKEHGGSFTPTHTAVEDGIHYVSAVEMADGPVSILMVTMMRTLSWKKASTSSLKKSPMPKMKTRLKVCFL